MIAMAVGIALALAALAYVLYPLLVGTKPGGTPSGATVCSKCGNRAEPGASFCFNCGSPL